MKDTVSIHPVEAIVLLALVVAEAVITLLAAAVALVLDLAGQRTFSVRRRHLAEVSQGKGSQPITTPAPVPQEVTLLVLEGIGPVIALEPAPAKPAPKRWAARAKPATTPQPQLPATPSPAPRRRRSPAAV